MDDEESPFRDAFDKRVFSDYEAYRDTRFGPPAEYIECTELWYASDENHYELTTPNWVLKLYRAPDPLYERLAHIILEPYPELLEHWKSVVVDDPDVDAVDRRRYYDVRYLRDVVAQHKHLTEGPGDPVLSPEDEELLLLMSRLSPREAFLRSMFLADPWKRALDRASIPSMYNAEGLYVNARAEYDPDSVTTRVIYDPRDNEQGNPFRGS